MTVPIIIGPKTRLGRELLAQTTRHVQAWSRPILIARSSAECAELAEMVSNADIVSVTESVRTLKALHEPVVIFCCAIGPLHPREVSKPLQDLDAIGRELSGIIEIYSSLPAVDTHFVLVSSILAISSGPRRFYYSGWKRAIEATIGELLANRPGGRFSVIYPGRLVAVKSFSNPFATTYADCAHVLRSIGLGPTRKRILGVDARLYLMARSFNTGILALLGRPV